MQLIEKKPESGVPAHASLEYLLCSTLRAHRIKKYCIHGNTSGIQAGASYKGCMHSSDAQGCTRSVYKCVKYQITVSSEMRRTT